MKGLFAYFSQITAFAVEMNWMQETSSPEPSIHQWKILSDTGKLLILLCIINNWYNGNLPPDNLSPDNLSRDNLLLFKKATTCPMTTCRPTKLSPVNLSPDKLSPNFTTLDPCKK
jgi:hypothetical protein